MKKNIWTQDYKITSYLVNLRGEAGLYSMLSFLQDVGWQHALHLEIRLPKNFSWVFTRQKLVMNAWPKWNETITLKTWLKPPQSKLFLSREYEIYRNEELLGIASATFTTIDVTTRKIAEQEWSHFSEIWNHTTPGLPLVPEKILFQAEDSEKLAEFRVRNSDLDLNMHVNNTKYAQWILDSLPLDTLIQGPHLASYEVNFLAEAKRDDLIHIQSTQTNFIDSANNIFQFQGQRERDGKPIFTALLGAKKIP